MHLNRILILAFCILLHIAIVVSGRKTTKPAETIESSTYGKRTESRGRDKFLLKDTPSNAIKNKKFLVNSTPSSPPPPAQIPIAGH